jgi:VanZ family protein
LSRPRASPPGLLLGYLVLVTAVITLAPFHFVVPPGVRLSWIVKPGDVVANVLGFLGRLVLGRGHPAEAQARVAAAGALLSATLEALQLYLPGRYSSLVDVASNALGAWLGALILDVVERRFDARLLRPLALELPLVNVIYLLVPLLWLDALAAGQDTQRLGLALLPGLAGGIVLSAVWRHRIAGRGFLAPWGVGAVAAAWYLAAAAPGLVRRPGLVLAGAGLIGLVTRLEAGRPAPAGADRRFELPTLRRVWPILGVYLLASALWPLPWTPGAWRGGLALVALAETPGLVPLLRALEYLGAFTLLGYTVAEARGRRREPGRRLAAWVAGACLGAAAGFEGLRGFHPAHGASALAMLLAAGAGLYGGFIYRTQLGVVRRLVGRG